MATSQQVRRFVDRILALKKEEDEIKKAIREVYAEADENEIDKTGLGQVVTHVRKRGKNPTDFDAKEAIFHGYLALYDAALTHTHAYAHVRDGEYLPPHNEETGELTDTQELPETATQSQSVHEARSMPAESMGDEISERVGLAGPACAHDDETANTKPAPNSQSAGTSPAADKPETAATPLPAVSGDVHEGIPAFLLKERKPLRPNCQHPDNCAGYGSKHCHSCLKARDEAIMADEVPA